MLGLVGGQTESSAAPGFIGSNAGSPEASVQASSASMVLPFTTSRATSTVPRRSSQEHHHDRHHHVTTTTTTTTSVQTTIVGRPTSRNFNVQPCMCFCSRSADDERGKEEDQLFLSVPTIETAVGENAFSQRNVHQQHPLDALSPLRIFARPILVNTTALLQRMRTTTMKQQQQQHQEHRQHHLPVAAAIMYNAALYHHLKGASSSSSTTGDGERSRDRAYQLADFYYSVALCHMEGALHHQRLCHPSVVPSSTHEADADEATFVLPMLASWNNRAHLQCAHYSTANRSQCLESMRKLLQVADVITRRIAYPPPSVSASLADAAAAECLLSPEERSIFRLNCFFLEQLGAGLAPAA
jgi:hypothetical protein